MRASIKSGGVKLAWVPASSSARARRSRPGSKRVKVVHRKFTALRVARPRVAEVPFDSARKYMLVAVPAVTGDGVELVLKGAVDRLVDRCTTILTPAGAVPLDDERRRAVDAAVDADAVVVVERGQLALGDGAVPPAWFTD